MVLTNKIIDQYPNCYNNDNSTTPYKQTDFALKTKEYCVSWNKEQQEIIVSKVIVLGDVGVGKTCLVNRFCHNVFNSNYKATIGVDFEIEYFRILGAPFHLQIWDTAGQERFKSIAQSYYRSASVIVIVFDLSKIETLKNCHIWLKEALCTSGKDPLIFLVATKKDLLSFEAFIQLESKSKTVATLLNAEFWAVSSRIGENVENLFFRIATLTFNQIITREEPVKVISLIRHEKISLKDKKEKEKSTRSCCDL